jgi:hypothetical protein
MRGNIVKKVFIAVWIKSLLSRYARYRSTIDAAMEARECERNLRAAGIESAPNVLPAL